MAGVEATGGRRLQPQQPLTSDTLVRSLPHRVAPGATRYPPARRAAAAVLATVLLAAACTGGRHGSGPHGGTATPAGTGVAVTSTAPPATRGSAGSYTWATVASPPSVPGGGPSTTLSALLAPQAGGGWLAAGTRTGAGGAPAATVWASPNAVSWTSSALPGGGPSTVGAATLWHGGVVVVGSIGGGASRRAVAWTSAASGAPFARATVASGDATVAAVSGGALGLFAAGTAGGRLALWYSGDARHWTRLRSAERAIEAEPDAHVDALLTAANGVYAGGWVRDGAFIDAAVWASADGLHWHRVGAARGTFGGGGDHVITALAQMGTGIVAAGGTRTGLSWSPSSWVSPDGISWSPPAQAFPMDPRPQADSTDAVVRALAVFSAAAPPAAAAAGSSTTVVAVGGSPTAQRVWRSGDGLHWTEIALPAAAARSAAWRATLVASTASTTVVADGDAGQPHVLSVTGAAWHEPSANPATFGPVQQTARPASLVADSGGLAMAVNVEDPGQALGRDTASAVLLTSPDGRRWSRLASFPDAAVAALAATPAGLAAVGVRHPASAPAAAAWTQTASGWVPAALGPAGATGPSSADALTRIGGRWVVVGEAPLASAEGGSGASTGLAVAWVSGAGGSWTSSGSLDTTPGSGPERPAGLCATSAVVAAVGSGGAVGSGTSALAWWSSDGTVWQPATVSPKPPPGETEEMSGCVAGRTSLVAYGTAAGPGGRPEPALWRSTDGTRWARTATAAFSPGDPFPIAAAARAASAWAAVGGSAPAPAAQQPPAGSPAGSAAASSAAWAGADALNPGQPPALDGVAPADAVAGMWLSFDGAATWQRVASDATPWGAGPGAAAAGATTVPPATSPAAGSAAGAAAQPQTGVDAVAFLGSAVVVAGEVDGRLALWTGTPAAGAAPSS